MENESNNNQDARMNETIQNMIQAKQLSPQDASLLVQETNGAYKEWSERDVLQWLAREYGLSYTDLVDVDLDRELLSVFPARVLLKEKLLPLRRNDDGVEVATSYLFSVDGLDTLKTMTGLKLIPVLAPEEAIEREMKKYLGVGADTLDSLEEEASIQVIENADLGIGADEDIDLDEAAEDASIIRFVNQVMTDAIALRATDIHFEPFENELRIRYRIDGVLQDVPVPSQIKRYQPAIISRVKILSHLDIAEKRLPQDGRIKVRIAEHEVDVRVSLIPMLYGEGVVMRLLHQDSALRGMTELKMGKREGTLFRAMLGLPHGIILVTGPTGSGKTTTLYAALNEINDSIRKIVTIEDPVEYHMRGVNQIQVSEKSGLTFARGLRSILRHDPDVVLVGEIRDSETAQIAIQASLTGHLVFSTLHTNDAPGALTRLVDMGVEPYLVASALEGVLAQRLVRVLCPRCKQEDTSPATVAFREDIGIPADVPIFRNVGCEACRNTGFHGRRGIFELMTLNEEISQLILTSHSSGQIREAARRNGLRSLTEDGWRLVCEGATTVDEVLRVTKDERASSNGFLTEENF
jgi:general secretion pathway protein E/type IV pilus assembly protein PilB